MYSRRRRKVSSTTSYHLIEYLLKQTNWSQEKLADVLEVSPAFISRVRTKERSLTMEHLEAVQTILKAPLGAILLAAVPIPASRPETAKLHELAKKAIAAADAGAQRSGNGPK